jgi:uncharacterized integral membrane protein (TIGR02327 family)
MEGQFAQQAIISILVHLAFISLTWWALMGLKIDPYIKGGRTLQARVLFILLTITIGSIVGNFFLDYLFWSQQLKFLF